MNIEEQIKEIIDMLFIEEIGYKVEVGNSTVANTVENIERVDETNYVAKTIGGKDAVISLLTNLLTQAQEHEKQALLTQKKLFEKEIEEAVRGFAEWLDSKYFYVKEENHNKKTKTSWSGEVIEKIRKQAETYLQSLDKGDKDASR